MTTTALSDESEERHNDFSGFTSGYYFLVLESVARLRSFMDTSWLNASVVFGLFGVTHTQLCFRAEEASVSLVAVYNR